MTVPTTWNNRWRNNATDTTLKNQKDEINTLIDEAGMWCTGRLANLFMNNPLLIPIKESTEKDNKCAYQKKKGDRQRKMLLHRLLHSVQSMGHSTLVAQAFTLNAEHG